MSILSLLVKGGYTMIFIGIAAFIGIWITVERYIYYRHIRTDIDEILKSVKPYLEESDFTAAINHLRGNDSPYARIVIKGLLNRSKASMEGAARGEVRNLEKGLGPLSSVVAVSPMLGFFGTVVGMIRAFMQIEALGGSVNPSRLAGGIWEALITTAAGLAVAIVFLIFYNIFVERENYVVTNINIIMDEIGEYLEKE